MKLSPEQRAQKIESYGNAFPALLEVLKEFPKKMWGFKPAPNKWSIHEIIIHLADSEANSYVRCRRLLAQPGSDVLGYDQDAWANSLNYHQQNTDEYLELLRLLRKLSYDLIKSKPMESYQDATINHSENGIMTFDDWLLSYEKHIAQHIEQMRRVYKIWTLI